MSIGSLPFGYGRHSGSIRPYAVEQEREANYGHFGDDVETALLRTWTGIVTSRSCSIHAALVSQSSDCARVVCDMRDVASHAVLASAYILLEVASRLHHESALAGSADTHTHTHAHF